MMINHSLLFIGFCLFILGTRLTTAANLIRLLGFLKDSREIMKVAALLIVFGFAVVAMAVPKVSFPKPSFSTEVLD
jgi:uncharacterized membrane protein